MTILTKMMLFLLIFYVSQAMAQVQGVRDIIKDPALSYRCKSLLQDRNDKVKVKQKLKALMQKNKKLQSQTPENKKSLTAKLTLSENELTNMLSLTELQIKSMEENIIRKGCPGIKL